MADEWANGMVKTNHSMELYTGPVHVPFEHIHGSQLGHEELPASEVLHHELPSHHTELGVLPPGSTDNSDHFRTSSVSFPAPSRATYQTDGKHHRSQSDSVASAPNIRAQLYDGELPTTEDYHGLGPGYQQLTPGKQHELRWSPSSREKETVRRPGEQADPQSTAAEPKKEPTRVKNAILSKFRRSSEVNKKRDER